MFRKLALQPPPLTPADLKAVEKFEDSWFAKLRLDVAFTTHFLERVNDPRNKTQITAQELALFFKEAMLKCGPKIDKLQPGEEAVLTNLDNFINVPFIIKHDRQHGYVMVAKTCMRKPDFKSPDPILRFRNPKP